MAKEAAQAEISPEAKGEERDVISPPYLQQVHFRSPSGCSLKAPSTPCWFPLLFLPPYSVLTLLRPFHVNPCSKFSSISDIFQNISPTYLLPSLPLTNSPSFTSLSSPCSFPWTISPTRSSAWVVQFDRRARAEADKKSVFVTSTEEKIYNTMLTMTC